MSLEKTIKDTNRLYTELQKHPVFEALPAYFEQEYPKLVKFLETYYEEASAETAAKTLEELQTKRDFVAAGDDLLRFFSNELLLGRDYFDTFIDKQTAIQSSNLLYRSKGTHYSIQQFFRVFFGFDVDVRYGRDEVLLVGDPFDETLVYTGKYQADGTYFPGDRLRFTFDDGQITVSALSKDPVIKERPADYIQRYENVAPYVEDVDDYVESRVYDVLYDFYHPLRQDIDYVIDYGDKSVILLNGISDPVAEDPWVEFLAENGRIAEGGSVKIEILRDAPAGSPVGGDTSEKRITNNAFYQLFALAISAPKSIKKWREPYRDFVHPAGMYLESNVKVESSVKLFGPSTANDVSFEAYRKLVEDTAELIAFLNTSITELNIRSFPMRESQAWSKSGFTFGDHIPRSEHEWGDSAVAYDGEYYSEVMEDSDRPDEVYRTRVNDISHLDATLEELDRQYIRMSDIDTIDARRMNETFADMSQTINTMDENVWHRDRTRTFKVGPYELCDDQYLLGATLEFPPEYAGCPGFIFGVGTLRPEKYLRPQFESPKMMDTIPPYQFGDSNGLGQEFPFIRAYDSAGEPRGEYLFTADEDVETGELVIGINELNGAVLHKSTPGPVSGYALQKLSAYGLTERASASLVDGIATSYENYFRSQRDSADGPTSSVTNRFYIEEIEKN